MAKRKICQAMAVVLALGMCTTGLTGCGNEKRADGKTEIEVVSYKPEAVKAFEKIEKQFNETHDDIHLTISSPNEAMTILKTRFIREDYPDIIAIGGDINYSNFLDADLFEAITGDNVFAYYSNMEKELEEAAKVVKSTPANLKERLEHLIAEMKALQSENESLKSKAAKDALGDVMDQVVDVNGIKLLATSVDGVDMNGLRDLGDSLKEKLGEGVIVLASSNEGKVNLVAMATDAAIKSGAHAGNLIKAIASKVGGGGGGRPNMAQAGGKNPAGIPDAIASVKDALSGMIK